MSKRFRAEMILEDFKNHKIDEYDAIHDIQRLDGLSRYEVEKIVKDVDYGFRDPWDAARDFERKSNESERRRREEDRDYWGD